MLRNNELACLLCLALIPASFALAQWRTSQDAEVCVSGTSVQSLDIAVCGRALTRKDLSDPDRASAHTARGRALRGSGRLTAALSDFDAALALNPYSANAFHERALTLEASGHYQSALEDFRHALALSPRFAAAHKNRGIAHFYAGNLPCAVVDLDAAMALAPDDAEVHAFRGFLLYLGGHYRNAGDAFQRVHALALPYPYVPLWRYLAGTGSGDTERGVLVEARAALLPDEWPQPLVDVYLGALGPEALIAALEKHDHSPSRQQHLAASHYYVAALARSSDRPEQLQVHLAKTLALSEHRMPERVLAEHELRALSGERTSEQVPVSSECRR